MQVRRTKAVDMYAGSPNKKCGREVHTLSCREKCTCGKSYGWSMVFSLTFLILWFWSVVLHLKYWTQVFGSLVLDLYGFGPWFESGLDYKKERRSFGWVTNVLNILRWARSKILVIGWWVIAGPELRRNLSITRQIYRWVEISLAHDQICKSDDLGYTWSLINYLYPQA